jgi:hypothetical protein
MADSGLLDETIRAVTMSWKGLAGSLAPEMLNVGDEAVKDNEMCVVGLVQRSVSFLMPRDALRLLILKALPHQNNHGSSHMNLIIRRSTYSCAASSMTLFWPKALCANCD